MFDIKKILVRSWHILWNYRTLWIFGFMLALAMGASGGGGNSGYSASDGDRRQPNSEWRSDWETLRGENFTEKLQDGLRQAGKELQKLQAQYPVEFKMGLAAFILFVIVATLAGLIITILGYVAETASIRMVDEYEQTGVKVGFWQGWKYGWSRASWRLFLVNFLVHIPAFALFILLGLVVWWIVASALSGVAWRLVTSLVAGIGLAFLLIFFTIILMSILYVLRDFAWRIIVLEDAGVLQSLRNAFEMMKRQWKKIGLMWLVMLGLKIAWGIAFFILVFPLLIVSILTALGGVLVAMVPALLTAGVASLLSAPDYWPWVFAAIVGFPLFAVMAFSPILLVRGWALIYHSSVWTLTYRELKALEAVAPAIVEPVEA